MPTEEQKADPNYRWDFNGKTFKYCPNCKGAMLAEWQSHKCGWGKEQQQQVATTASNPEDIKQEAINIVQECLINAKDILKNTPLNMDEYTSADSIIAVADMLRRTEIVLKFPSRKQN